MGRLADRERVLALLWLVGALLTALSLVLPYSPEVDVPSRAAVAALAVSVGLALMVTPPLPDAVLHGLVAVGTGTVAFCTSLGMPEVEGVMFLLPIIFASAAFSPAAAAAHFGIAVAAYALVLTTAADERTMAPWVSFAFVTGVGGVLAAAISLLVTARQRAVAAGRRDRRIASTLQRTLLPESLAAPPGIAIAARYVPAAKEADVGGDLYDAFQLPGGQLAIAIGDVAGKGLPAAAMVGRVRAALHAYALDDPDPARVLSRLNRMLASDADTSRMTTLAFAVLEPGGGQLRWASAGHPPPLMVPADAQPRYLESLTGVPLGVLPWARFAGGSARLAPGDRVLLYTDGLVESRGDGLAYGMDRLALAVTTAAADDPETLLEAALSTLSGPQRDDVAVVGVALTPLHDRLTLTVPGNPDALAGLRRVLRRWLNDRCDPETGERLLFACGELATNAIVHGGSGGDDAAFGFEAVAEDGRIRIAVQDGGEWRGAARESDEAGRGLMLARGLVDRLEISPGENGTTVVLEQAMGARQTVGDAG